MLGVLVRVEEGTLDEEDVKVAVIVLVEKSDSGAHNFGVIAAAGHTVEMEEVDAGVCGAIGEDLFRAGPEGLARPRAAQDSREAKLDEVASSDDIHLEAQSDRSDSETRPS